MACFSFGGSVNMGDSWNGNVYFILRRKQLTSTRYIYTLFQGILVLAVEQRAAAPADKMKSHRSNTPGSRTVWKPPLECVWSSCYMSCFSGNKQKCTFCDQPEWEFNPVPISCSILETTEDSKVLDHVKKSSRLYQFENSTRPVLSSTMIPS